MAIEKAVARIGGEPRRRGKRRAGLELAALVADMGEAMRAVRIVRVRRHGPLDLRPRRRELPILGQRHGVIGARTRNRRRSAARGCPSTPRSGASVRCGRSRRSGRWGSPHWRRPARRAAMPPDGRYKAAIAASVRPANTSSKKPMWLASRSDTPEAGPWPPPGPPARPRRHLVSSAPAPCRRGPGQNRDRRRWPGHRPRAAPG